MGVRIKRWTGIVAGVLVALGAASCTGSSVSSPEPGAGGLMPTTSGARDVIAQYPRRSWHPIDPPPCCGGLDIRLTPAPPMTVPCEPAPYCPPPAPPPSDPPPCPPPYEPPPCPPPYEPPPCEPPPPVCATSAWTITPHARYWRPAPSGDMLITRGGVPGSGTRLDFEDDLDLETADAANFGLDIAYGAHRFHISYEPLTWHGSSTLTRSVVYHAVTYGIGETVDSDVEMTFLRGGYDYALVNEPGGKLRVGLEAYWWQFDATLDGSVGGKTRREFSHVFPAIYLDADARFGSWHIRGKAAYGTMFESDRYLVDLEAAIGIRLWQRLTLDVGWRYWNLVFHETTNEGNFKASGPFVELSIDI